MYLIKADQPKFPLNHHEYHQIPFDCLWVQVSGHGSSHAGSLLSSHPSDCWMFFAQNYGIAGTDTSPHHAKFCSNFEKKISISFKQMLFTFHMIHARQTSRMCPKTGCTLYVHWVIIIDPVALQWLGVSRVSPHFRHAKISHIELLVIPP